MRQSPAEPASPADSRSGMAQARHELAVVAPFRLDLTVSALRRLSTNMVDVFTADGAYVRVLGSARAPVFARVAQTTPKVLTVILDGSPSEHAQALALVRRMLGVKPPRYPTLWEACVNAIVFQQLSLFAASAIMRRLLLALAAPFEREGLALYQFPSIERVLEAKDDMGRA